MQLEKALSPMLIKLLGMVMEVRPVQIAKAELPMLVTLWGMVTIVAHLRHLTIVLSVISKPSLVSSSHRVAPQLLLLVNEELFINELVAK